MSPERAARATLRHHTEAAHLDQQGQTVMWVATIDRPARLLGFIAVADPIRPTAAAAVQHLHELGIMPSC
jgi:P-type Cu+ transporter